MKFVAFAAEEANRLTIDAMGDTAAAAIAAAVQATGLTPEDFVAMPATDELAAMVEREGGAGIRWDDSGEVADLDLEGLERKLVEAAREYADEGKDEDPSVLYVQLSRSYGWTARFWDSQAYEMEMTRWDTSEEVAELYNDIRAGKLAKIQEAAGDIEAGWDDEWSDD